MRTRGGHSIGNIITVLGNHRVAELTKFLTNMFRSLFATGYSSVIPENFASPHVPDDPNAGGDDYVGTSTNQNMK